MFLGKLDPMRISHFLFGDSAAAFPTELPLDEAVHRLSSVVEKYGFGSGFRVHEGRRVLGSVSPKRVRLTWMTPFVSNVFRPRFAGRFESTDGKVVLVGKFGVIPVVKAWACTFSAMGMLGTVAVVAQGDAGIHSQPLSLLMAIGVCVIGFVGVRVSQWLTLGVRRNLAGFISTSLATR